MRLLFLLLFLMTACFAQQTGTIEFSWDPMPAGQAWLTVRVYERTGSAEPYSYHQIAEAPVPATSVTAQLDVGGGQRIFVARSFDGFWESIDSNSVAIKPKPNPPQNLEATPK
jgi:hypothetical protein